MLTVELSDHPGQLLTAETQRRGAAATQARSAHEKKMRALKKQRETARRQRKWWTYLLAALAISRHKRRRPRPVAVLPSDAEEILRAGIAGEQLIARELSGALNDDWTLLRGYRNARGEIDHLLLGPRGLFAIEVKSLNATVHVNADTWLADKYDRYGNHVDQYPIADRGGRSPSEQLNQSADALASFLYNRGQAVPVRRVVALAHERSRLGRHTHLTVHVAVTAKDILRLVRDSPDEISEERRKKLQLLIEQDHEFHDKRRARPPRTRGRRR